MTEKFYDIYFDPADLEVDHEGRLENPEALQIIEFEYDDDTDAVSACRHVDLTGAVIEENPDLTDLEHAGDGDDPSIDAAIGRFDGWLDNHLEWRESYHGDYYNPPEYVCVGISGYVDEPPYRSRHISDAVIRAILNRRNKFF